ncbi:MAG TPA: hypothetical protein V6D15_22595 [Oculatellaceae cyanobacterium]|jgi:hypothetical protein
MPLKKFLVLCSLVAISVPAIPLNNHYSSTKLLPHNYDQGLSFHAQRPRDQSPHRGTGRRELYQQVALAHL